MRFNHRSPLHWFAVALVLAVGLFTFNHARGQSTGAAAAFEGRPSMAGAQGGLGAQAGMPQGGLGVQGNEAAQRQLNLRKPSGLDGAPALPGTTPAQSVGARSDVTLVPRGDDLKRDSRTPPQKVKKAVKRTLQRSRTGVGEIDANVGTPR
ncbi:MAG: hypothetical protein JWQ33_2228 [Ramlibacter sp.]|nr:hypothetical protein [Ramlibacter sp.]